MGCFLWENSEKLAHKAEKPQEDDIDWGKKNTAICMEYMNLQNKVHWGQASGGIVKMPPLGRLHPHQSS